METIREERNLGEKYLISKCLEALRKPEATAVFPTETTYVLACKWTDVKARKKVVRMKRHGGQSFQLFVPDVDTLTRAGFRLSEMAETLAEELCPAALTIVDQKDEDNPPVTFNISNYTLLAGVADELKAPLGISSLGKTVLKLSEAMAYLRYEPDLAVDRGDLSADAVPTTVVEIKDESYRILRQGAVRKAEIDAVLR